MSDPAWTTRPRGLQLLHELQDTLLRVQRIELLTKLARAKKQLEATHLVAERKKYGVGSSQT
jgi:hypothetical protein